MKCDCCQRKRRLFESYETIHYPKKVLNLCPLCSLDLYKLKYAQENNQTRTYTRLKDSFSSKSKKSSLAFVEWYSDLIRKIEKNSGR